MNFFTYKSLRSFFCSVYYKFVEHVIHEAFLYQYPDAIQFTSFVMSFTDLNVFFRKSHYLPWVRPGPRHQMDGSRWLCNWLLIFLNVVVSSHRSWTNLLEGSGRILVLCSEMDIIDMAMTTFANLEVGNNSCHTCMY